MEGLGVRPAVGISELISRKGGRFLLMSANAKRSRKRSRKRRRREFDALGKCFFRHSNKVAKHSIAFYLMDKTFIGVLLLPRK